MRNLLNYDGPVFRFITKIVYSVWLNILWFICCIPIVTIGASTTALCYCCQKIARDEEGYVTRSFFHAFKNQFKKSTIIGVIMTLVGIALAVDGYALYHLCFTSAFWTFLSGVLIVALIAYTIVLLWVFPLHARFDNTVPALFKNAIMIGMRFIVCTALMFFVFFCMGVLIYYICTPCIIFGVGTCVMLNSMISGNIFIQLEQNQV